MAFTRPVVIGNWKMNGLWSDAQTLVAALVLRAAAEPLAGTIAVCPPATLAMGLRRELAGSPILLGGQDCHAEASGAHTGDIAAPMLADAGCRLVIVGHSERRADHGESDAMVRAKATAALAAGLVAIICIGETLDERDAGRTLDVLGRQLDGSLPEGADADRVVIAYEPVWAIGSGRTATADQIAEVHGFLRARLAEGLADGDRVRLLYGGSVKAANAAEILAVPDVDGALVGGASLEANEFWSIFTAAARRAA